MKLIKPSYEILPQSSGLEGIFKQIEVAGRTCYKSNNKITTDSAKGFVERMIASGHGAMLEHGTVYLTIYPLDAITGHKYRDNKYSKYFERRVREEPTPEVIKYITTNYRVLVENNWLEDLQYICEPTEFHEKRISVKFLTQIAISREYNRHRVNSIAESSTRYCNYSKDKFGNEITINQPHCVTDEKLELANKYSSIIYCNDEFGTVYEKETFNWLDIDWWLWSISCSELAYMKLIELGWKAQDARTVLPLATQTELIHTAFISDWKHFFELRDSTSAHPDARELAKPLHEEFIKNGWL